MQIFTRKHKFENYINEELDSISNDENKFNIDNNNDSDEESFIEIILIQ